MEEWDLSQPGAAFRRAEYLRSIAVWPGVSQLDYVGWMSNFDGREAELAGHLLDCFAFISSGMTKALFTSAFHQLSSYNHLGPNGPRCSRWTKFLKEVVVTHVEGETPSTTDSGYMFARLAKKHLGIDESQVVPPERALRILNAGGGRPIVFVDDFLGSGDQAITTWNRKYPVSSCVEYSFEESAAHYSSSIYYVPLFATENGIKNVSDACNGLVVAPTHVLKEAESVIHPASLCWPDSMRSEGVEFIRRCSARAGISMGDWKGYKGLGLALAFDHGTPDATLPIFTHESDAWRPLIR